MDFLLWLLDDKLLSGISEQKKKVRDMSSYLSLSCCPSLSLCISLSLNDDGSVLKLSLPEYCCSSESSSLMLSMFSNPVGAGLSLATKFSYSVYSLSSLISGSPSWAVFCFFSLTMMFISLILLFGLDVFRSLGLLKGSSLEISRTSSPDAISNSRKL